MADDKGVQADAMDKRLLFDCPSISSKLSMVMSVNAPAAP